MRKLIPTVLIALLTGAGLTMSAQNAQEDGNYTMDVQFRNIPDSVQFTLRTDGDSVVYRQKVRTKDNRLHFSLNITEDYPVALYITGKNPKDKNDGFYIPFYGGKGIHHRITSTADGFSNNELTFDGATWDADWMERQRHTNEYRELQSNIHREQEKHTVIVDSVKRIAMVKDPDIHRELSAKMMAAQTEYFDSVNRWVLAHPESPNALKWTKNVYTRIDRDSLVKFAEKVPLNMREMPEYKLLQTIIGSRKIEIGSLLDDYDLVGEDYDGTAVRLSQFTTPYILVDFNSLGCGPCRSAAREDFPWLLETYGDRLTVVSYSVDEERKQMEMAHEKDKTVWPTIWNGSGPSGEDCIKYSVTGYPRFFLFGPDRRLIAQRSGWGPHIFRLWIEEFIVPKGE